MLKVFVYILCATLLSIGFCRPPQNFENGINNVDEEMHNDVNNGFSLDQLGIEYNRYLQQVIDALEKDETFKKKLENAQERDIKSAKIAEELEYVNHHVRNKLDELKRTELQRLRELAKQAYGHENEIHFNPPGHLDHENPHTFEVKDLKKLIHKVAQDLEVADQKRKEMFKTYEMKKHFEREQKLQNMTEEERKNFLQHEEEIKKREHEGKKRIHHPGSKQQLEEVWETQDHMSKTDFEPKTFFVMHDVDGNGFLDEDEIKSLFLKELDKLYKDGSFQGDPMERAEEMERMREHVFQEVDKNRDRLISWEEFYAMSLQPEFNEDQGWQPLEDQQIYTQEELQAYERQRLAELEMLRNNGQIPPHPSQYPNQGNHTYYQYNIDPNNNGPQEHPQQFYQQAAMQKSPNMYQQYPQPGMQPNQQYQQPAVHQPVMPQRYQQHQQPEVLQSTVHQRNQQASVQPNVAHQAQAAVPQQQLNYGHVPQSYKQQVGINNNNVQQQQQAQRVNHADGQQKQANPGNNEIHTQYRNSQEHHQDDTVVHKQFETVHKQSNEKYGNNGKVRKLK